jgi:hypothetical protein
MAVQEQVTRPAPFVETLGEDLAKQVVAQTGVPIVTTGIAGLTRQAGETDAGFKARQDAARAFTTRQQNLAGLAPQVAGQDPLQAQAQAIAQAQAGATGIAGFQPFLTSAQQEAQLASGLGTAALGGLGAAGTQLTQAGTTIGGVSLGAPTTQQVQAFTSPFQAQVIDATLQEFDRNKAIQQQQIRDQQAALGVLGSGRAGVQLAEFGTGAARERALLQAGLLQQGFNQAQALRQQDIANRFGLGQAQAGLAGQRAGLAGAAQNLGQFRSGLAGQQAALGTQTAGIAGANVARLGSLGALNQAQAQAQLDAQREAARQAAFQPQEQLDRFAAQVQGLIGGYPGATQQTNIPNPTPLQTALGVGTTLAGIYGAISNPSKLSVSL